MRPRGSSTTQDPALALQLRAIPYASSLIVNIAYRRDQISHPLDGFGAVVPAIEGRSILAVSFLSVKFPNRAPAGTVLLRVFIGGADPSRPARSGRCGDHRAGPARAGRLDRQPPVNPCSCGSAAILGRCLSTISGHLDRVASIRRNLAKYSRLYLAGIAYDGVGIPDCIHAAEMTADALLDALANPAASAA